MEKPNTIIAKTLNDFKKANPTAKVYTWCAWGREEVISYFDGGWLRREVGGMSLCGCPNDILQVEYP